MIILEETSNSDAKNCMYNCLTHTHSRKSNNATTKQHFCANIKNS